MTNTLSHVVALTPQELPGAQSQITDWCTERILALAQDLKDARQNLAVAKRMRWRWKPWQAVARKAALSMVYYTKIRAAVTAGYLIVPNFPAEVIAVRVQRPDPVSAQASYPSQINTATADLTAGPDQGRYVDETLPIEDYSHTAPDGKGGTTLVRDHRRAHYGLPDFPMLAVKPLVLEATERAMALRIFDRIAVVHQDGSTRYRRRNRADPVVVGQILNGGAKFPEEHRVTFFIAWWLTKEMI